jgi:hypothetical protein
MTYNIPTTEIRAENLLSYCIYMVKMVEAAGVEPQLFNNS